MGFDQHLPHAELSRCTDIDIDDDDGDGNALGGIVAAHTDIDTDDDDSDDNAFGSIAADTVNDFDNEYPMWEARAACAATNAFISRVTRPLSDAAVHPNQRG